MNKIYMNTRVITSYDWNYYFWFKYVTRHWLVRWWIENVENGAGMHLAKMVIGNSANIWQWDGVECQPVRFTAPRIQRLMTLLVVLIPVNRM